MDEVRIKEIPRCAWGTVELMECTVGTWNEKYRRTNNTYLTNFELHWMRPPYAQRGGTER